MEILPSARRHGISDDDIRHGFNNAVAAITTPDQPEFTMIVGADLTKSVFALCVADAAWRPVQSLRLSRAQFERWFADRAVSRVVMVNFAMRSTV